MESIGSGQEAAPAKDILRSASIKVSSESYSVISVSHSAWEELLAKPELSPRMQTPFLIFKDDWEITLVLDDKDFARLGDSIPDAQVERGFRLLSFDANLPFEVIGFMALISGILAEAGISILPFSSFSRDHVLLRQTDLASALKSLRDHVSEIC